MTNFNPIIFAAVASQHVLDGLSVTQAVNAAAAHHDWNVRLWEEYLYGDKYHIGQEKTVAKYLQYFKLIPDEYADRYTTPQEQTNNA